MDRLEAMKTFVRVVERGSFSAVAKEFGATQSAVSKQVAALEARLGAKLLVRSTRAIALTRAGEHATYVGRYVETLVRADGGRLPSTTYVARRKQVLATRSGTSLHVYLPDRSYACELAGTTPSCFDQPPAGLPESEVLRVAVASGAYDVARAEGAQIAGEEAECFTMKAHGVNKRLPQFGAETDVCLASDGVPLRKRVYSDRLDALEAQHVDRRFDDGTLAPVLGGFEQAAPPTRR